MHGACNVKLINALLFYLPSSMYMNWECVGQTVCKQEQTNTRVEWRSETQQVARTDLFAPFLGGGDQNIYLFDFTFPPPPKLNIRNTN